MKLKIIYRIIVCFFLLSLVACANRVATADFNVQSAHYLNPDIYGRASPVVVTVYQLKAPYAFKQASYTNLTQNSVKVLGNDLVDKRTFEIRPGQQQQIKITLSPNTRDLGIVAAYRNIQQANWHKVVKVPQGKKRLNLNLALESQGLVVTKAKKRRFRL